MKCAWGFLLLLGACVSSDALVCPNGEVCPAGTACDTAHGACVQPSQLTTCDGLADGMACDVDEPADGICDQGVCIFETCGDGYVRGGEECDGEIVPDDANCTDLGFYVSQKPTCTADCTFDRSSCSQECGDGMLQPQYEICEASTPVTATCVDYGFGAGQLGCINCGPETSACIPFGWELEDTGNGVGAMAAVSSTDVWAVTFSNASPLVHYDGTSWTDVDVSACGLPGIQLDHVVAPAADLVFFSGASTIARRSGGTCTSYQLPDTVYDIWAASATDAWASIEGSGLYHFDGSTWTLSRASADNSEEAFRVWGSGPNDVYAITNGAEMLRWNGASWSPFTPGTLEIPRDVWGSGPSDLYVGGRTADSATIMHWNGVSWSSELKGFGLLTGITGVLAGQKVGTRQYIEVTRQTPSRFFILMNDGSGWVDLDAPINYVVALAATSDGAVFAGVNGTAKVAHMRGSTRIERGDAPAGPDLVHIAGNRIDDLLAATYSGTLWHFDGGAWTVDGSIQANDVSRAADGTLFVVNSSAIAKRKPDGTWLTDTSVGGYRVSAVSATDAWVVNNQTDLYHWHGGSVDAFVAPGPVQDMWAISSTRVLLAGEDGNGAAILDFNGSTFTPMTLPATDEGTIRWLVPFSATHIYAGGGNSGKVMHYDGNAWTYIDTPPQTNTVWGTPNDLFAATFTGLQHFDGTAWNPVATGSPSGISKLYGLGDTLMIIDYFNAAHAIVRSTPW